MLLHVLVVPVTYTWKYIIFLYLSGGASFRFLDPKNIFFYILAGNIGSACFYEAITGCSVKAECRLNNTQKTKYGTCEACMKRCYRESKLQITYWIRLQIESPCDP